MSRGKCIVCGGTGSIINFWEDSGPQSKRCGVCKGTGKATSFTEAFNTANKTFPSSDPLIDKKRDEPQ